MFTRHSAIRSTPRLFSRTRARQEDAEWQALQKRVSTSRRAYVANQLRRIVALAVTQLTRRVRPALRNPLVIIPPLVLVLILGWQHYTYAGRDLSLPSAQNLLPNSSFELDNAGVPAGWQISNSSSVTSYQTSYGKGYTGGRSFSVALSNYQDGDVALGTPRVTVEAGKSYLFKSYYQATTPFALLARHYAADGTSTLQLVRTYSGDSDTWSTASDAFTVDTTTVAVQFVYRLYANGSLQLNGPYLEPQQDIYLAPITDDPTNLIPNSVFAIDSYSAPVAWSTYHSGNSTAAFSFQPDISGSYVETQVNDYKSGQAKWQYVPQPVQPDQYYQLSLSYRSTVPVPLVAEYVLQNGQRQDETVTTLPPADDWTNATAQFQTVPNATDLFISLPLEQNGTVASRSYALTNLTKSGAPYWLQPMASITFDDGWQQTYQNAVPLLKQYKYGATFYVNPLTIETPGFMTAGELSILSNDGNEIAAHGYEHDDLTAINDNALAYQLREGRDYLQRAGFQVTDVAPPYGRSDAEVQWYAHQYFTTLRGQETGINTRQNLDPYNLKVINVNAHTSPQDIATALQQAKDYHGWVIFSYHQVGEGTQDYGSLHVEHVSVTPASFEQQVNAIHASGVKVMPIAAAYATTQHPQARNQ